MSTTGAETQSERSREGKGPGIAIVPPNRATAASADLSRENLPAIPEETDSPLDLRAHLKSFAAAPNFNTFIPVAKALIEIAELPAPMKQELISLYSDARPREETLMLSDSFQGYEPLVKRLPGRDDAASWAQDRAHYPELFCILGIVTALGKLAKADRMLTQSVLTAEPENQGRAEREDLRKRLMGAYESALLPGGSSFIQLVESEARDKNSLAATKLLKGYLVPIFEIDHGIKIGFFKKVGFVLDEEVIMPELADLAEGGMNPVQSKTLKRIRNAAVPPKAKTELNPGVPLKDLVPPPSIDLNFVENVLRARADDSEKVIFMHGAVAAAEIVQEKAYYALVERLPRGTKAVGDSKATNWPALLKGVREVQRDLQDFGSSHSFDIPLLVEALAKVSAIENTGYFGLAKRTLTSACQASHNWQELHFSFRVALPLYIEHLSEQALKRRRKE